jgi:hypothetical protein
MPEMVTEPTTADTLTGAARPSVVDGPEGRDGPGPTGTGYADAHADLHE